MAGYSRLTQVILGILILLAIYFFLLPAPNSSESISSLEPLKHIKHGLVQGDNIGIVARPSDNSKTTKTEESQSTKESVADNTQKSTENKAVNSAPLSDINPGGINVVSMSLYGNENPRYTTGIIRNAELVKKNFPGWTLRLYLEKPSSALKYGKIPDSTVEKLKGLGVDIKYIDPNEVKVPPMMWRFLIAEDMSVDRFIVRDCDSRLTPRDASTVKDWIKSGKPFQCVRDHPSHSNYALSGGLWGAKPRELRQILNKSWEEMMRPYTTAYIQDMDFLGRVIWPAVKDHAYCSDSYSCNRFPSSHPFSVKRNGEEHVGQVYDGNDRGRPGDMAIIRRTPVKKECVPP